MTNLQIFKKLFQVKSKAKSAFQSKLKTITSFDGIVDTKQLFSDWYNSLQSSKEYREMLYEFDTNDRETDSWICDKEISFKFLSKDSKSLDIMKNLRNDIFEKLSTEYSGHLYTISYFPCTGVIKFKDQYINSVTYTRKEDISDECFEFTEMCANIDFESIDDSTLQKLYEEHSSTTISKEEYSYTYEKIFCFSLKPNGTGLITSYRNKKRILPFTLKSLWYMTEETQQIFIKLFKALAKQQYIWEDIVKDLSEGILSSVWKERSYEQLDALPYLSMKNIFLSHNRKELLERKYKTKLPNIYNKKNLIASCLILDEVKRLQSINRSFLDSIEYKDIEEYGLFPYNPKNRTIIHIFYGKKLFKRENFWNSSRLGAIVKGYIKLCYDLEETPDFCIKMFSTIEKKHNEMFKRFRKIDLIKKYPKGIKIKKNNPFSCLNLPDKYERIVDINRLFREAEEQDNCVASYAESIEEGTSGIYSLLENGKRYTIELTYNGEGYEIIQFFGKKNTEAPKELVAELNDLLSSYSLKKCI